MIPMPEKSRFLGFETLSLKKIDNAPTKTEAAVTVV
jgi:hypothetical protein